LLVSITGEVGMLGLIPKGFGEAYINQHTCLVRFLPELRGRYFPEVLRSSLARVQFNAPQRGIKNSFRLGDVGEMFVPLPPIEEQQRIVAKVDELMALCDRLEAARAEREAARDRLAAASLARLNAPDPETFADDARFALNVLPALTMRPDQVKQFRETILNLAVRGKLASAATADEPVEQLLERLAKEGSATLAAAGLRAAELRCPYPTDEIDLNLPTGWGWVRAHNATRPGQTITYGILKPEWVDDGVPTVRVTEMKSGTIDIRSLPKCAPARAAKFEKTRLELNDLLVSKDGTIGKTAFVPAGLEGGNITQHVLRFPVSSVIDRHFVRLFIDSPVCQQWLSGETKGVALQGVNVGDFRRMPIPIPPLAEQHRIVAKVAELMSLCDQLEARLNTAIEHRSRLLETVLHGALESADRVVESATSEEPTAA
jgi:type I restriction enzyme S subunit